MGLATWWIAPPAGISAEGWHLFIIFVLTIITVILKPLPMGAVALLAVAVSCLTNTLSIQVCLDAYGQPVVWLVVFAFFIARGLSITGLGARIAYFFVSVFGRNVIGLSYGFAATDLLLAPAIPSNTARGAGIIFPIIKSLSEEFEGKSELETNHRKLGAFLIKVGFQANIITSSMFLTALAGNPLVTAIALSREIDLSWGQWALAALAPGLVCFFLMPLLTYLIFPPKTREIKDAHRIAKERLREMGPMSTHQKIMWWVFVGLLLLWVLGDFFGIHATTAALLGIGILLLSGVLTWEDILKERAAWGTFIWFGALLMLAGQLEKTGLMDWFGLQISSAISDYNWGVAFVITSLVYFYAHYFFASTTALITTIYAVFLQIMLITGVPPFVGAMTLAGFGCLSSCLTHYGTGSAPVYFGANYVTMKDWWTIGAILSIFYIIIWFTIGLLWWKLLGFY